MEQNFSNEKVYRLTENAKELLANLEEESREKAYAALYDVCNNKHSVKKFAKFSNVLNI